jgi:VWFA-related protein
VTPGGPARPASDIAAGLIKLDVVVSDKSGKPVSGLEAKDFTLLDDGLPSNILSFQSFDGTAAKPDPPVEVILVIDTINHKLRKVPDVQPDVVKFLRQNDGHLAQPVSIYRVSEMGLSVTAQPTTDGNDLVAEISRKGGLREVSLEKGDLQLQNSSFRNQVIDPQTALRAALGSIVLIERRKPGRKLLIWVGYGGPVGETSFEWITEFSTRIREARISLSSVTLWRDGTYPYEFFLEGVKSARQTTPGNLALEVLAAQSGGRVLEDASDMAGMIDKCVEDASAFYTVTFDPPRTEQVDEYHALQVQLDKPGLVASTSHGYYDQPVYYDQPYVPAERVTAAQLELALVKAQGVSDAEMARQLSDMQLTERMSSTRLSSWKSRLPGAKSWAALVALADASALLDLPPAEVSTNAAPDLIAQRLMQSKIIDYLLQTIPKLPDFIAARTTVRYREPPLMEGQTWKTAIGDRSLHWSGSTRATVLYRNGFEVVDSVKGKSPEQGKPSLKMRGTFGPILNAALDAVRSDLVWSHWEQDEGGTSAVFRYSISEEKSHYELTYCCLLDDGFGAGKFQRLAGYHGEIATDPDSGAILRLTVEADLGPNLHPNQPILRSGIVVEYGPIEIGRTTHICLVKSIAILRVRTIFDMHEWGESFKTYGPFETMLDDASFGEYHMFRGETRVLPGFDESPEQK